MTKSGRALEKAADHSSVRQPAHSSEIKTNLQGQRLGRKGRDTRERILEATRNLIAENPERPPSLSAVAREASLRMSSIYVYFKDLTELMRAMLEPVMATSEQTYIAQVRDWWPDSELEDRCYAFVKAFFDFWRENSHILHLRNQMADQHDDRMMTHRICMAQPVIDLLNQQMGDRPMPPAGAGYDLASVLFTGLERVVTVTTDSRLQTWLPARIRPGHPEPTLRQQARLLALAINDSRLGNEA